MRRQYRDSGSRLDDDAVFIGKKERKLKIAAAVVFWNDGCRFFALLFRGNSVSGGMVLWDGEDFAFFI